MNRVFMIWPTNLENQGFVEEANFEFITRFLRGSGKEPKSENRKRDESEIVAAFSSRAFDGFNTHNYGLHSPPSKTGTFCSRNEDNRMKSRWPSDRESVGGVFMRSALSTVDQRSRTYRSS